MYYFLCILLCMGNLSYALAPKVRSDYLKQLQAYGAVPLRDILPDYVEDHNPNPFTLGEITFLYVEEAKTVREILGGKRHASANYFLESTRESLSILRGRKTDAQAFKTFPDKIRTLIDLLDSWLRKGGDDSLGTISEQLGVLCSSYHSQFPDKSLVKLSIERLPGSTNPGPVDHDIITMLNSLGMKIDHAVRNLDPGNIRDDFGRVERNLESLEAALTSFLLYLELIDYIVLFFENGGKINPDYRGFQFLNVTVDNSGTVKLHPDALKYQTTDSQPDGSIKLLYYLQQFIGSVPGICDGISMQNDDSA